MSDSGGGWDDHAAPVHDEHTEEHVEEGEPWLISYADLMTLLFGLFALMFSFAKFDDDKATVRVDKALAKFFGQSALAPQDASKKPKEDNPASEVEKKGREPGDFSSLGNQLKIEMDNSKITKNAKFRQMPDGFEINFVSSLMFASGRAELTPDALETLHRLGRMIKSTGVRYQIRVEGHTDDNPIHSPVFPSNWELSAARAATILRIFEQDGYESARLMAIGYGSSRPAFPNRTPAGVAIPDNQALNRRVIVKIIVPEDAQAAAAESAARDPVLTDKQPPAAAAPATPSPSKSR